MAKKPIALIIMDGYGINPDHEGNAIYKANKPHLDAYMKEYPNTQLQWGCLTARWETVR